MPEFSEMQADRKNLILCKVKKKLVAFTFDNDYLLSSQNEIMGLTDEKRTFRKVRSNEPNNNNL